MSDWDDWSECRYPQTTEGHSTQDHAELVGEGSMYRMEGMAMKQQQWDDWEECVEEGKCPQMPSVRGAVPCTGGNILTNVLTLAQQSGPYNSKICIAIKKS